VQHEGQPLGRRERDARRIGATEAHPGVLDGVFGLAERAEHPVGQRPQARPMFLEALAQPFALVHQVTLLRRMGSSQPARASRPGPVVPAGRTATVRRTVSGVEELGQYRCECFVGHAVPFTGQPME
jgi:hypothetical protein